MDNGGKIVTYGYDHNDLRVEKTFDSKTTKYYYDGSLMLAEKDGEGNLMKVYVNDGEGIMSQVRSVREESGVEHNKQRLYYHYDSLGSVSLITSEIGKPLQEYYYTPYGDSYNVESDPVNSLRFVGRYGGYTDDDTGLVYFWHRWYDSDDGRWISRDPIGTCGGSNIYEYAGNRPTTIIDYSGLIGTYGKWCGGGWSGGTVYGKPDFDGPYKDDLDLCCREHDKDWYDCDKEEDKRERESKCENKPTIPSGETIEQCKNKANKKFCDCLSSVKLTWDPYKTMYLIGASIGFGCSK